MVVIVDETGGGGEGGTAGAQADVTFRGAEPIVWEFIPGQPENGSRYVYTADASQVTFGLVVSLEALKSPNLIRTVAREWGATWNANAAVPGVVDIAETQDVKPLGGLQDIAQVAIRSTSGRSEQILVLTQDEFRADVFASIVGAARAQLDALEA